jgi:formylglycine-generating enzyme required for sulfatase activity
MNPVANHWRALVPACYLLQAMLFGVGCVTDGAHGADEAVGKTHQPKTMTLDLGKGVTMKLVLIPAGKFMMGSKLSPAEDVSRYGADEPYFALEHPRHQVTISKPFYIGVYEVTQPQFTAVMGFEPWKDPAQNAKMLTKLGPDYPASWVHWHEATEFCGKLSKAVGRKVSLPTEAQWEYACRAGSETAFCFGDDPSKLVEYAWLSGNMVDGDKSKSYARQTGHKKPNAWGLYDMHGNVWEWCRDWFDKDFYASGNDVDPVNTIEAKCATVRGGSWYNDACHLRSSSRNNWYGPTYRHYNVGFRVVVE